MRSRFAFSQTSDGRLLVTMEALWGFPAGQNGKFCVSAIDDENTFIQHVVLANLSKEDTVELIAGVLLVVSGRQTSDRWIAASVNQLQLTALGLRIDAEEKSTEEPPRHPLGFVDEEDLARVFLDAPVPVCMLAGPKHTFTFINPAYVKLLGRSSAEELLGMPVREALSDLEGQPFFALLDKVYESGVPFTGLEVPGRLYTRQLGAPKEIYFDFIYHPVRDKHDQVCGILCQANDVTERVLEKQVRESREEQLYRQWAELDAIYRTSPVGMCLISATDYSILRLNEIKAKLLGGTIEELIGKKMTNIFPEHQFIPDAYKRVVQTRKAVNFELSADLPTEPGRIRTWLWNLNPVLSPAGSVDSIASIVIDITERPSTIQALLSSQVATAQ